MYPRNAASPERIAVGAVVQISDGAVQTSGVAITVRGQGGAEGASGGTIVYGASGIVYYTPTQAETNFTSFVVIASKAGCLPVAQTIITTASITAGTVLLAPVTHTSATVPTVSAVTGLTAANLDVAVSTRMATYTQPTGFLAATFPATIASTTNITAGTLTTVTNLTNLPSIPSNWLTAAGIAASALNGKGDWNIGKTGYSLTQTFPTNFASLAITGGGAVTAGTVSDKTGYSLSATQAFNNTGTWTGNVSGSVGSVTGLTVANLDVAVSSRLASAAYVLPDNAGIAAIPTNPLLTTDTRLDKLDATVSGVPAAVLSAASTTPIVANAVQIKGQTIQGSGSEADPWGP